MKFTPRLFRVGAVCALLTAITTLGVHVMPNLWANAVSFEQQIGLCSNPFYLANRWIVLLHCALVLLSMFLLGLAEWRTHPVLITFGLLGFLAFAFTELVRTALSIFAVNRRWRAAYAAAADDATRAHFRGLIEAFGGVNDALFFLFDAAFLVGLVCYGIAFLRSAGPGTALGVLFVAWSLLTLPPLIDAAGGAPLITRYFE
jgi:hypothetical protein